MSWLQLTPGGLADRVGCACRRHDHGAVAVFFAPAAVPMVLRVGLAIDYSFYIQVKAQVNVAADAAAIHAVRAASRAYSAGHTTAAEIEQAGNAAGAQWFSAQIRVLSYGTVALMVTYTPSPSTFTAHVTYPGTVPVQFAGLLAGVSTWPISGTATAVVSDSYMEVVMLLDNSSSMLIGATTADIVALERATPCSTQGTNEAQPMSAYSWNYPSNFGYGTGNVAPPVRLPARSSVSAILPTPAIRRLAATALPSRISRRPTPRSAPMAAARRGDQQRQVPEHTQRALRVRLS